MPITAGNGTRGSRPGRRLSQERASASSCVPGNGQLPPTPAFGTRDAYNIWDISELVPGDQNSERLINCVQNASD